MRPEDGETVDQIPPDLQELARQANAGIFILPSVPDAVATLESFNDLELPGVTDRPEPTLLLPPDQWDAAARLPVARIDALAEVSTPIWQLIAVATAAGAAADVQELCALLDRRTASVRLGELARAVDSIAASMSPADLARLDSEGETIVRSLASTGPVPPDVDRSRVALAIQVVSQGQKMIAGNQVLQTYPPMLAYVIAYRYVAMSTVDPKGAAEKYGLPTKPKRRWPFGG